MARKRMIDPGIWDSEQVMKLTPAQFKLYIYFISQADDEGRLKLSIPLFKNRVHPLGNYNHKNFLEDISKICQLELVIMYCASADLAVTGKRPVSDIYLSHPNWHVYQKFDRKFPSHLPDPKSCNHIDLDDFLKQITARSLLDQLPSSDMSAIDQLPSSPNGIEEKGREEKKEEEKKPRPRKIHTGLCPQCGHPIGGHQCPKCDWRG